MAHYYDPHPEGEGRPGTAAIRIDGRDFSFDTAGGVFSSRRVDFGTVLLIEAAIAEIRRNGQGKGRLLDLGCGYGAVGIILKRAFPAMDVVLSDVNERALRLAKSNAERNQVSFARFVRSDAFEGLPETFDWILTNPPIRAGKAVVHRFFQGAYEHLAPGGTLFVVIQKKQGAPSASSFLEETFGNCEPIEKSAGFRVLRCVR
ncbi:MAG: class I SAM-dependent methyltransferase [Clostridia bacterium]|nr:class I SAM-dependent methyltransferase [Clostridia bacterium]